MGHATAMRTIFANLFSAAVHVFAIGGLAVWSADQAALEYQVASGRPLVIEFSPAPAPQSPPESQPVSLDARPAPAPVETPQPTPDPEAASLTVDRQEPLVEISEEVASAEAPPAEATPTATAQPTQTQHLPPELAKTQPPTMRERTPTTDPPLLETSALPAPAIVEAGATVDTFPRKLPANPAPPYPADAWRAQIQGRVVLKVRVETSGLVGSLAVHASSGWASLDDAALTTVRTWRFEPARRRGAAVAHEVLVPVRFTILPN